ncbi:MAG: hypothetical protein ACXAC5_01115 [Promethearchaeota archaeon]|jgi:hypothetical protein
MDCYSEVEGKVMEEFNEDWLIRDFEELDEKLPGVAKIIVSREIDFRQLVEEEEPDPEVIRSIIAIMREHLICMSEMTADEIERAINMLCTACEVVCMVSEGTVEERDGKYYLSEQGRVLFDSLEDTELLPND